MKKIISMFLAGMFCIFGSLGNVFAGGVNKEETLSDGTKLIYISTDRIPEVIEQYRQQLLMLKAERYSTTKDLTIKGVSLAATACGWFLSSKLEQNYPNWCLAGKISSCILGFIGFLFPDYHEHNLIMQYGCRNSIAARYTEPEKDYLFYWGPEHNHRGLAYTVGDLETLYNGKNEYKYPPEGRDSGAVIVIRPKSKWYKEGDVNTRYFLSGVYTQLDMGPDSKLFGGGGGRQILLNHIKDGR